MPLLFLLAFLAAPTVRTVPERLVNGSAFLVRVTPAAEWSALQGTFDGRALFFEREDSDWVAFAGVDYDAPPGGRDLVLEATSASGAVESFTIPIAVEHASRPTSELHVSKKYVEPNRKLLARIKKEQAIKAELFKRVTPERLARGAFQPPVSVATSEGYGVERLFNGKRQTVHYGLDYRAPTGTPIAATNGGRVLLARDFFYEGRCVAIDHGQGLLTIYLHMSRLDVREGQQVAKGQRLGLSGASGRATGPHLHLAVRWQGIYLDPATVLSLPSS